jgi:hypothetical protein
VYKSYSDEINYDIPEEKREMEEKKSPFLELVIYKSNLLNVSSTASLFGLKYLDILTV